MPKLDFDPDTNNDENGRIIFNDQEVDAQINNLESQFDDTQASGTPSSTPIPDVDDFESTNTGFYKPSDKTSTTTTEASFSPDSSSETPSASLPPAPQGRLQRLKSFSVKHRRKLIGGGGVAGIIISIFLGLSILQGPLQFIHAAQLLTRFHLDFNTEFMDNRAGKLLRHRVRGTSAERRNLGVVGNKVADFYEGRLADHGITPRYEGGELFREGRIVGFDFDPDNPRAASIISELRAQGYELSGDGNHLDLSRQRAGFRRNSITTVFKQTNLNKISGSVASRTLKTRGGVDFHPLKNIRRAVGESYADWRQRVNEEKQRRRNRGTNPDARVRIAEVDAEGNPDVDDSKLEETQEATENAQDVTEDFQDGDFNERRSKLRARVRNIANDPISFASAAAIGCVVYGASQEYDAMKYNEIILPMLRTGMDIVTIGYQLMAGHGFNLEELGEHADQFYDEESGTSWLGADGIQRQLGNEPTGHDISDASRPSETKPGALKAVDGIRGIGGICTVLGNQVVQFGLDAMDILRNVTPIGLVTNIGGALGGHIYGDDVAAYITGLFLGDPLPIDDLKGAQFGAVLDDGTRLASNDSMNGAGGRRLSDEENQKVQTAINSLQRTQFEQQSFLARIFNYTDSRSLTGQLAAKFNYRSDPINISNTLVATAGKTLVSPAGTVLNSVYAQEDKEPYGGFPRFGFSLEEIEDDNYDDPYDNEERLLAIFEARQAREANCMEETSGTSDGDNDGIHDSCEVNPSDYEEFNKEWGRPCFGTELSENGTITHLLAEKDTRPYEAEDYKPRPYVVTAHAYPHPGVINDKIAGCDGYEDEHRWTGEAIGDPNHEDLILYRFMMADLQAANSIACFDGDMLACENVGMTTESSTDSSAHISGQIIGDPDAPSTDIPCAPGTKDLGTDNSAYSGGQEIPTRLCEIQEFDNVGSSGSPGYIPGSTGGVIVNSRVSGAWLALYKAALSDGVTLVANSAFRTMEHQQRLWVQYGRDSAVVARPGYSKHQSGHAIDFDGVGGKKRGATCETRNRQTGSEMWVWLEANARDYGFQVYSVEPWHWDALDVSNRC